jgi:uncharacterized protein YyaL (SSP411 family)
MNIISNLKLPYCAKEELIRDRLYINLKHDPDLLSVVRACGNWLCRAQEKSTSSDGGVSRHFSLINGWGPSYPETTGYIIQTMISLSEYLGYDLYKKCAKRMLDWIISIQLPDGGFQGGNIASRPVVPVTFNTGQILIGLSYGVRTFDDQRYVQAMHKAAVFLRNSLDPDGCWRKHPTPFANAGEKAYETHVSWGLLEADRVAPGYGYSEAALKQVDWALTKQHANGWIEDCCLDDPHAPLTHTIGYFLRGVLEAYSYSQEERLLHASLKTAESLRQVQRSDGAIPGRLRQDWSSAVKWTCLTGNSQIAECWLLLYRWTGEKKYLIAAQRINSFVRRTIRVEGSGDTVGGVKGSFPIDGDYGQFQYLNWAAKFTIDANLAELKCNK